MRRSFYTPRCFSYVRVVALIGLLGLLSISPSSNTFAQNEPENNTIYLPVFSESSTVVNQTTTDGHEHTGIGHIPEDGRFTTNDGGALSWPPQVKYIDETKWDANADLSVASRATEISAASGVAIQSGQLRDYLGSRFTFINVRPIKEKWDDTVLGHVVTYFSYSNNITIEALLRNGAVESIETFAASDMQPPLRQNEVDAAIVIARQYWQEQGNTRVNELQGFTIQTFQTEGEGGYYDTRMTYVSFHLDETSVPELLTWVDLTNETVFRAAIDDGGVQYEQ